MSDYVAVVIRGIIVCDKTVAHRARSSKLLHLKNPTTLLKF